MYSSRDQGAGVVLELQAGNVFVWLPTGCGKSLCYQVLDYKLGLIGLEKKQCCTVPLISLMVDQVQSLRRKNAKVSIISFWYVDAAFSEFIDQEQTTLGLLITITQV